MAAPPTVPEPHPMFLMFNNRLGCFKSLLISAVLTIALLVLLGLVQLPRW